jgi:predicted enzyme related to lactoylglutathione lyase
MPVTGPEFIALQVREVAAAGVPILTAPVDGPFGRTFTFQDPDGYAVTVHD